MCITSRGRPQSTELKRCVYLVFQQPLRYLLTASPACDSFLRQGFGAWRAAHQNGRLTGVGWRRAPRAICASTSRWRPFRSPNESGGSGTPPTGGRRTASRGPVIALRGSCIQRGKPSRANSVPRIAGVYATRQIASSLPRLIRVAVSSTILITTLGMRPYSLGEVPEQGKKPLLTSGNRK